MKRQLLALTFALTACGAPSGRDVRTAFLAQNPAAVIADAYPAEGGVGDVYWDIKYRLPPDTTLFVQTWLYVQGDDGKWRVTFRSRPSPVHGAT